MTEHSSNRNLRQIPKSLRLQEEHSCQETSFEDKLIPELRQQEERGCGMLVEGEITENFAKK